jgi:trimethylamine--corrinoid protein Co-methyltransferase
MMVGAMAQLSQYYKLPFFGTAGCTDSQVVDIQAGVEGAIQDLVAATVGQGLVHDTHSWLDHGSTVAPTYFVLGHEILGMVDRFMEGIPINDETLALEVLKNVGSGGNFLREPHTLKHFKESFYSKVFERSHHESWINKGAKLIEQRLKERTLDLIKEPDAHPLDPKLSGEFDKMQASWAKW